MSFINLSLDEDKTFLYHKIMTHILKLFIPVFTIAVLLTVFFIPAKKTPALSCAGSVNAQSLSADFDPRETIGEFEGKQVFALPIVPKQVSQVLGEANGKRVEVDVSRQRVYAYEADNRVFEFVVSTGKWYPTPKGTFSIKTKVRAQKMSGGSKANNTYYYLPNVPYVMFFGNQQIPWTRGFALHGTYWHNNFGQPMSHGCVNLKIPDAEALFRWAPVGTKVVIY